jgi:hypothetical protein
MKPASVEVCIENREKGGKGKFITYYDIAG